MRRGASDSHAMPVPTSAWRRDAANQADSTRQGVSPKGDGTVLKLLDEAPNSILTRIRETFALKTWL